MPVFELQLPSGIGRQFCPSNSSTPPLAIRTTRGSLRISSIILLLFIMSFLIHLQNV